MTDNIYSYKKVTLDQQALESYGFQISTKTCNEITKSTTGAGKK